MAGCLLKRKKLQQHRNLLRHIYEQNNFDNPECSHVIECANNTNLIMKLLFYSYMITATFLSCSPIAQYIFFGIIRTPVYHKIGLDTSKPVGYVITYLYHVIALYAASVMYFYVDALYAANVYNVSLYSGLVCNQIEHLDTMLDDKKLKLDNLCLKLTFRNIIQMHKETNE